MPGTLFVVATPIGNLEDLTFRALRTLREVDLIAAEDTRRTARLLARYEIRQPLVSLREHNEAREAPRLVNRLQAGVSIALVSDAGTPGISDPGMRLVQAARLAGLPVVAIPGPSAVATALSVAGVPADEFVFLGFPPSSGKARTVWLEAAAAEPRTVVFFEAPHRVRRTVGDLIFSGVSPIFALREVTKIHEKSVICQNVEAAALLPETGEYTIVFHQTAKDAKILDETAMMADFSRLTSGLDQRDPLLFEFLAWKTGTTPMEARKIVKKALILAKRLSGQST